MMVDEAAGRYGHVECRKREGAHYTPDYVSEFMAEQLIAHSPLKETMTIADPAVGDGELLLSLIRRLYASGVKRVRAYGFDTNEASVAISRDRLQRAYPDTELHMVTGDFLELCLDKAAGGRHSRQLPPFDLLIANPPYIRTQVLGAQRARELSEQFGLRGRLDIYQAFLIGMQAMMHPQSVASVIVSNRFLTTKGAGQFRQQLDAQYTILGLWDFGDTRIFQAAVLPAVILLTPNNSEPSAPAPFSSVYLSDQAADNPVAVANPVEALRHCGIVACDNATYAVKHGQLVYDGQPKGVWRLQDAESERWLGTVAKHTWCTFREVGRVRVGIKTTADRVFIRKDWTREIGYQPELLRPLTTHHIGGRYRANGQQPRSVLYPHTSVDGKRQALPLEAYPMTARYLEAHRPQLEGRRYVIEAKRRWYEIWVPHNPDAWDRPKVVFRDICEQPMFWMDTGSVINGDCYWMTCDNGMSEEILWLVLAVANSTFIETFYDTRFQNKLYSNKRRFITQYVEQFPLPNPDAPGSRQLMALSRQCAEEPKRERRLALEQRIDQLVWEAFQVSPL